MTGTFGASLLVAAERVAFSTSRLASPAVLEKINEAWKRQRRTQFHHPRHNNPGMSVALRRGTGAPDVVHRTGTARPLRRSPCRLGFGLAANQWLLLDMSAQP